MDGIADLLEDKANPLAALWDSSKVQLLIRPTEPTRALAPAPVRKTARQEIDEEMSKRRYLESAKLVDVVLEKLVPLVPSTAVGHDGKSNQDWIKASTNPEGKKKIVSVDCGTALCTHDGVYVPDVLVRLVVTDFVTDRVLADVDVALPLGYEAVDLHPSLTGIDEVPTDTRSFAEARTILINLISSETVVITQSPIRSAASLRLDHGRWLSVHEVLRADPKLKQQGEGAFYVRSYVTVPQLLEAYLGEAASDRFKVIPVRDRMVETALGMIRLIKAVARTPPTALPVLIPPPRRHNTIFLTHIPSNWSEDEVRMILPSAAEVDPIDFFLDTTTNEWRGETSVLMKSQDDLTSAFARLTACTDMFVGWEWLAAGKVSEDSLKALGADFGAVVGVRIQDKYLTAPKILPGKEESRPFGFISLARFQDAVDMAKEPRQIVKDGVSFHVKISKKPISAFKRIPLGEGEDYIEAFIM